VNDVNHTQRWLKEGVYPEGAMMTRSGQLITPLDPDPDDILIEDIAGALAKQPRFTGHVSKFYSVAQHSVNVCSLVIKRHGNSGLALVALLHDGSEAYLSDISHPVKYQEPFKTFYREAEAVLEAALAEKFDIAYPWPKQVKDADGAIGLLESRDLMPPSFPMHTWGGADIAEFPKEIKPWGPEKAEREFLALYESLTLAGVGVPEVPRM
jgi:hypothetical protein